MQNRPIISYGKIAESEVKFLELITIYAMLMNMPALTEDVGGGGGVTPRTRNPFGNSTKLSTSVRKCEFFYRREVGQ